MSADLNSFLISLPFGQSFESVNSTRYHFSSAQRGDEPFVILQRTAKGSGIFEFEGQSSPVPPGHAFLAIVPEESAYFFPKEAGEPWQFAWINFYGSLGLSLCREFRKTFGSVLPLPDHSTAGSMFLRLAERVERREFSSPHEASAASYAFLMEWAHQLALPSRRQEKDPVETALQLCKTRFREPLGIKELAAETGFTREHFTRLFIQRTGKAPARHLRELRVGAARQMLQPRGVSLKEIALRCGFPSVRSLKQALGSQGIAEGIAEPGAAGQTDSLGSPTWKG